MSAIGRYIRGSASTAAFALALAAPVAAQTVDDNARAIARLSDAEGTEIGTVEFTGAPDGVLIEVLLTDMSPGEHGIHLHQTGSCGSDFEDAGDHFAPEGKSHGFLNTDGPHAGDLPNVFIGAEGTANAHFFNDRVQLDDSGSGLMDEDGTAVILHELPDLYGADSGTGDRIACGVVEMEY